MAEIRPAAATEAALEPPQRVTLFGLTFTPLDLPAAARLIAARPPGLSFDYVVTPNAANIVAVNREPQRLAAIYNTAYLGLLDSAVVQLLARSAGEDLPLAAGSDLTALLFGSGIVSPDEPLAIVGSTAAAIDKLKARYGLREVRHHYPPFGFLDNPVALEHALDFVAEARTRFVFFAIGAPQAHILAFKAREQGRATGLGFCIGASLNFLTGAETRAPGLFRAARLEWLYRMLRDPRRMVRRVVVDSLPVLPIAFREIARRRLASPRRPR